MKLKRARRYVVDGQTIEILENPTHPAEIDFLRWVGNLEWERVFILK